MHIVYVCVCMFVVRGSRCKILGQFMKTQDVDGNTVVECKMVS